MSNAISDFLHKLDQTEVISTIEHLIARLKTTAAPVAVVVEQKAVEIGKATWDYVETNGLHALVGIAKATFLSAAEGTPFPVILAMIEAQAIEAGIALIKGASAVVAAAVQADLVALQEIPAPIAAPAPVTA